MWGGAAGQGPVGAAWRKAARSRWEPPRRSPGFAPCGGARGLRRQLSQGKVSRPASHGWVFPRGAKPGNRVLRWFDNGSVLEQASLWAAGFRRAAASRTKVQKLGFHVAVKVPVLWPPPGKRTRAIAVAARDMSKNLWG